MKTWCASLTLLLALTGSAGAQQAQQNSAAALANRARTIFGTLPAEAPSGSNFVTAAKIRLGRMLYYETRLSKNQTISCNSCHPLDKFGADGLTTSVGHRGQRGDRNAPTVYNAALHIAQFWDGRAPNVEEQAKGPVGNPVEMAMPSEGYVVKVMRSIPGYEPLFREAFPEAAEPVSFDNMARAIGAFERRLMTPSRFDTFLAGGTGVFSGEEQAGLRTFLDVGCITCHMGVGVGGSMYQKIGLVKPYETKDLGRFKVTGEESDRYVFKVPSLRNVTKTGPYFSDGGVKTLQDAVRLMGRHQLGRELDDQQIRDIVAFLGTLQGQIDPAVIRKPELPESGPKTPGPDPS